MSKIDKIAQISPETRLIISPVLPTSIPALNRIVVTFNRLIFSKRAWWQELGFGSFVADGDVISSQFLSFNREWDKIHLGYRGMNKLTALAKAAIGNCFY